MEIITRAEAIERGLKYYFTGKPCKYGHVAGRFTSSSNCLECQRICWASPEARARHRAYREKHKEKISKYHKRHLKENPTMYGILNAKKHLKYQIGVACIWQMGEEAALEMLDDYNAWKEQRKNGTI